MTRVHKVILVLALTVVGVWGCSKAPPSGSTADRTRQLEARVSKLENELKDVIAGREALRIRLATAESQLRDTEAKLIAAEDSNQKLMAQTTKLQGERDTLQAQIASRINERDQVQAQYDSFRKNIKELLGQAETTIANPTEKPGKAPIIAGLTVPGL